MIAPPRWAGALAAILASGQSTRHRFEHGQRRRCRGDLRHLGFVAGPRPFMPGPPCVSAVEPLLASYYAIPTFMFYPVFIIVFGVGKRRSSPLRCCWPWSAMIPPR